MAKNHFYWLKIGLFCLVLVIFDQITKYLAYWGLSWRLLTSSLSEKKVVLIKNILSLEYLQGGNTGAAWGILQGQRILFIIITIVAIVVIFKILFNIRKMYMENFSLNPAITAVKYLLVVLMAGAIGNVIDRIIYGSVVDFIKFEFIKFPIFNVADMFVTCSCIAIIFLCMFKISGQEFSQIFDFSLNKNGKI